MKFRAGIALIVACCACVAALSASSELDSFAEVNAGLPGSAELVDALNDRGYDASLYDSPGPEDEEREAHDEPEKCAAIWLGEDVPLDFAVGAIIIAYEHYPFLKYISLSRAGDDGPEDLVREVFIGGSTETALEEGCVPISASLFKQASRSFRELPELHAFIGRKRGR